MAWDRMEAELYRRAVEGVDEPVFFGGDCIGTIKRYSDQLLLAGVKAHRPEYRDKQSVELSGPQGAPIRTQAEIAAQLQPYESAVALLVDSLMELHCLQHTPAPASPPPLARKSSTWKPSRRNRRRPRSRLARSPALGATPLAPTLTVRCATAAASSRRNGDEPLPRSHRAFSDKRYTR